MSAADARSDVAAGGPADDARRRPLSERCALAALVLYAGAGLLLTAAPTTPWVLLVLVGLGLLAAGLRTGRAAFVGLAVALAVGARLGGAAVADEPGPGGAVGALALVLALAAVGELARLAVDAGARRGPVRIAPEVRRRLLRDAVLLAVLASASAAIVLLITAPRWGRPPAGLLPLGVLALPLLLAALTVLARRERRPPPAARTTARPEAGNGREPGGSGSGPPRPGRAARLARSRRPGAVALVVVVAAVVVPLLAGLGARTSGPFGERDPARPDPATAVESTDTSALTVPSPLDQVPAEERQPPAPPLALVLAAGIVALVLVVLLGGGEGLVSADDRRPDVAVAEEPLRGAPAAPVVQALPPEEVAAIVDDALGYLRAELEPRLAVRCAYAAVAGGLGRHELARLPAETELEFLARQLGTAGPGGPEGGTAGPDGGALARLTDLFEVARFSNRPIDAAMRAEALAALEEVRRSLPTSGASAPHPARAEPPPPRTASHPAAPTPYPAAGPPASGPADGPDLGRPPGGRR